MKRILLLLASLLVMMPSISYGQTPVWQGKGRIAYSCDGNEHDDDDWGATPMSLALMAARGLQDKVTLFVYSDHIWGSNNEKGVSFGMTTY